MYILDEHLMAKLDHIQENTVQTISGWQPAYPYCTSCEGTCFGCSGCGNGCDGTCAGPTR